MTRTSIHGRLLQIDPATGQLYHNDRPLGGFGFASRGRTFYVDSNVDAASGVSPEEAVGTLAEIFANDMVEASRGDVVVVMPNHSEALTGAGALTIDIAGVTVIGLGAGKQRPLFTLESAVTTIAVTGADTVLQNLEFQAGAADVATCFNLDAKGFHLLGCRFSDAAADENFLAIITSGSATDNVCDGLTVEDNYWLSPDAACTHLVAHTGNCEVMRVNRNTIIIPGSTAGELIDVASGDVITGLEVTWNLLQHAMTAGELLISNDGSTNSGIIAHNRVRHADVTSTHDLGIDGLGCGLFDNLSTSTDSLSGVVLPAIDVNS
jgi:hypothetical protein